MRSSLAHPTARAAAVVAATITGALVGVVTAFVLVGRPTDGQRGAVAAGALAGGAALIVGRLVLHRTRRSVDAPSRDQLDVVTARMSRAVPIDETLQQVVDAFRQAPGRRVVELWQHDAGALHLTHCAPLVDRPVVQVDARTAAVVAGTSIVGRAWAHTWLPDLVDADGGNDSIRLAALAVQGTLLGALVLRRGPEDRPFDETDDEQLGRVQRPLASALNQSRLTAALEATVAELRQRNVELQASRARLVSVADAERRRLERDLHDGAQAQLTALQVKLQLTRHLAEQRPARTGELLDALESDLLDVTTELRHLAHGIVPPLLLTGGLGDALREAASRAPTDVQVEVVSAERFRPAVEAAVYYCCVEALQNVAKHAGRGARATVRVARDHGVLRFSVADNGRGLPTEATQPTSGQGLVNITDRIGALGGTVEITAAPGGGTAVCGQVPVDPVEFDVSDR